MQFRILTRRADGAEWWEDYDKDVGDPQKWAETTVAHFNDTLRPGEQSRTLLKVEVLDTDSSKHHKWTKSTAGMSQIFRGRCVDIMFCERCGITGKRYGLSENITIDSKYRKKVYQSCATAQVAMGRRK